jgi:hypothetical protein
VELLKKEIDKSKDKKEVHSLGSCWAPVMEEYGPWVGFGRLSMASFFILCQEVG